MENTLPQVPIPAGIPGYDRDKFLVGCVRLNGTSINPSLLKTLEKAVNTAKPMVAK